MEHVFETPDGRTLAVTEGGDPDGVPCPGAPGDTELAAPIRARCCCRSRARHSQSSRTTGRATADPPRNREGRSPIARSRRSRHLGGLGIDRALSWGHSGGGPHVLACAALLPDLIPAAASLASPAPWEPRASTGSRHGRAERGRPQAVASRTGWRRGRSSRPTAWRCSAPLPTQTREMIKTLVSPADAAVFTPELAQYFVASAEDGPRAGRRGVVGGRRRPRRSVGI